ncbi:DUF3618 domain-containing protein [Streptomyces tailanensis]|uniref:DUF3618 domain-containing protein n=1 Tax=Streptomyces tailanensis TaxID=2569858 RepID=UPI00155AEC94|nr:DUF3618 domain-containing protein [Streptomyces tailanensis]
MGASGGHKQWAGAKGPDELRRQIEMTRSRLGDTVEELAAKADVKGRARARVHSVRERVPGQAVAAGGAGVAAVAAGVYAWRHSTMSRPATPLARLTKLRPAPTPMARLRRQLPSVHSLHARGRQLPSLHSLDPRGHGLPSLHSLHPRRRRLPTLHSLDPRR